jgi:hypothetical protein
MPAVKPTSDGLRTVGASWPSNTVVPEEVKKLLDLFLSLLDHNEEASGTALVEHIFTEDAVFKTSSATFKGAEGMTFAHHSSCRISSTQVPRADQCIVNIYRDQRITERSLGDS